MARAVLSSLRPIIDYPPPLDQQSGDGAIPQWKQYLTPPGGLDSFTRPYKLPANVATRARNVVPFPDGWRQRSGTAVVGGIAAVAILYALPFEDGAGGKYLFRWTRTGVDIQDGPSWVALAGPALTASTEDRITTTAWGGLLIFSNGVDGTFVITPTARTYALIPGAPVAVHLTTFNRRVVASVVASGRIQWCVAGNYLDWTSTALGAGYEDLLSTEAGSAEKQSAVIAVTDEVAYAIRGRSWWQMEPTRDVAKPFAFSRQRGSIGSQWTQSCCAVPGGAAFMSDDGVYLIQGGTPALISNPIRDIFAEMDTTTPKLKPRSLRLACMAYSAMDHELRLSVPIEYVGGASSGQVYRYSLERQLWSEDYYFFPIRAMSSAPYKKILTIGEVAGTIGAQSGTIGEWGASQYGSGLLFITNDHPTETTKWFIAREAPDLIRNSQAADIAGSSGFGSGYGTQTNNIQIHIRTAIITSTDPSRLVHIHGAILEFEGDAPNVAQQLQLTIWLTTDGWATTESSVYSGGTTMTVATSPTQLYIPINVQRRHAALELDIGYPCNFRLIDFRLKVTDGAVGGQVP